MKIKKNDNVLVIAGKDKGKSGKVARVLLKLNKVVVENVNVRKRHMRPRRQGEKGQILQTAMPIHASNVMFICPKCSRPARLGYQVSQGNKSRACKRCKESV